MKKLLLFAAAVALLLVTGCKNEPPVIAVQSVTVAPDEIALIEGAQQQLAATVLPEDATSKDIVWSSSAPDVASVDESGKVTAVAAGLAIIKATCGGKEGTCAVTVSAPIPVETVIVAPETLALKPGEGADLTATVLPADATDQTVVWTSSDEAVATVSETGHVTAVATGSAIITATCGGQAGTCDVNVGVFYAEDFEEGLPSDWILIDADGDGKNWTSLVGSNPNNILGHDDSVGFLTSASYDASALTPDNYAFTPAIKLAAGENKVSAWLNAQDASWPAETFGIGVSLVNPATLTASTVAANTTMLNQWTMTAAPARPGNVSPRVQGTWYQYTVDLSAYENKTVYIFFRHFDCTDMFRLNLDDVQVYSPSLLLQSSTPVLVKNAPHKRSVGSNQVFKSKKNHR